MAVVHKYIHGSADSTDTDVVYVVDEIPSLKEAKEFCCASKDENRNIVTIEHGTVKECYKGSPDEINNSLFETYAYHEQSYPLAVKYRVHRDIFLKTLRSVRIILSHLSRSEMRAEIKNALGMNGTWEDRLNVLDKLAHGSILDKTDFSKLNKNMSAEDVKKVIAFQLGQCLALLDGVELYTKKAISDYYPGLHKYMYRETNSDIGEMKLHLGLFFNRLMYMPVIHHIKSKNGSEYVKYSNINYYNVRYEKPVGDVLPTI